MALSPDSYTHHKELISGVRSPRVRLSPEGKSCEVTLSPDSYTHHKELISGVRSPR